MGLQALDDHFLWLIASYACGRGCSSSITRSKETPFLSDESCFHWTSLNRGFPGSGNIELTMLPKVLLPDVSATGQLCREADPLQLKDFLGLGWLPPSTHRL